MPKNQKSLKPKVLFNASVILSGWNCPSGGSAAVLKLAEKEEVSPIISEVIWDEVCRHIGKIKMDLDEAERKRKKELGNLILAPEKKTVKRYMKIVIDEGDAHVLATAWEQRVDFLVTLDKKHLLVLKDKVKDFEIVTPGELLAKPRLRRRVRGQRLPLK